MSASLDSIDMGKLYTGAVIPVPGAPAEMPGQHHRAVAQQAHMPQRAA